MAPTGTCPHQRGPHHRDADRQGQPRQHVPDLFECQYLDPASRESQARFRCTRCAHADHADVNAAKNILRAAGHAVPACGDLAVGRSVKQEPVGTREEVPLQPELPPVGIPRL
uniref:transposase n=1 Tax=Allosalinactinospora lopnorensis TaxID=1352348 RepID=UPI001F3B49A0|nr:transposase [Allosalinactinospora lopnorensis]